MCIQVPVHLHLPLSLSLSLYLSLYICIYPPTPLGGEPGAGVCSPKTSSGGVIIFPELLTCVPSCILKSYLMHNASARAKMSSPCPTLILLQNPKPKITMCIKFTRESLQVRIWSNFALRLASKTYPKPSGRSSTCDLGDSLAPKPPPTVLM